MASELLDNFKSPPSGYGIVPFYWWMGDPLLKERLGDQLDWLKDHNISGLQVNYAHSDRGGRSWGLTYENDPPLFSDRWWELFGWFMEEAKKRGMSVSLSDYTLFSPGQGHFTDKALARHPEMMGQRLCGIKQQVKKGETVSPELPGSLLCAVIVSDDGVQPITDLCNGDVPYTVPCDGELCVVCAEKVPYTYDPMHPRAGEEIIEEFFGMFERHFPGEGGKGLNFFFSDELDFGIGGNLWNDYFADEFLKRKGYDIRPQLFQIFYPGKKEAVKTRLDYYDVIVALEEENYFQKVYNWHGDRNMIYGCDHGGRGYNVVEFGDYMRTQKYNQGPGCDQPRLSSDIVKNKVASSISHLHKRPRVWLEGFYGSGWGTTTEQLTDAIARNYVMGQNLLSLHGLYYSTHGGYWEWAPPCNCFRMPYWKHMSKLTGAVERLSYTMTRGVHCCDVGIIYPVAAFDGGIEGDRAASTAFHVGERLYRHGVDFDYLDRESILNGEICDGALAISKEKYRFIVIPEMRTLHADTYRKLAEAAKNGVRIVSVGQWPFYSDGDIDAYMNELSRLGQKFDDVKEAIGFLSGSVRRDVIPERTEEYYVHHRSADGFELYMTYGIPKGERCFLRGNGAVSYLNVWDGKIYRLEDFDREEDGVSFVMPIEKTEFQLFLVGDVEADDVYRSTGITGSIKLDPEWDFELEPTMDNRWGDYELPASDEILPCQIKELTCDERKVRVSYGTYFLVKEAFETESAYRQAIADAVNGIVQDFVPYDFSMRYGVENMPGHQGYHGLKGNISDDFLTIGKMEQTQTSEKFLPYDGGMGKVFYTHVLCEKAVTAKILTGPIAPETLYVNGKRLDKNETSVELRAGMNRIVAGYTDYGRTYLVFACGTEDAERYPLSMKWFRNPSVLPYCAAGEGIKRQTFSFLSPPAMESAEIVCTGTVTDVTVDGKKALLTREGQRCTVHAAEPAALPCQVRITVESVNGTVGGAVFEEPIRVYCGKGRIPSGDWSKIDGLKYYSGGAVYHQELNLSEEVCRKTVFLRLERVVSTAELLVNGESAGVKVASPWRWDISSYVRSGRNDISIRVYNTIGNHYEYIPTRFRSGIESGLIGDAFIEWSE